VQKAKLAQEERAGWNAAAAAFLHGQADKVIGLARASGADHRSEIEHMHDYM